MSDVVHVGDQQGHFRTRGFDFFVEAPSNKPFCHFCQKRVQISAVIVNVSPGNPKHICKTCVEEISKGFEAIEDELHTKQ